ncbi:zinc finger protein 821-like isoform X1 [Acipenser ruthenus]|uniref:zinc finger protein 821-like isoform X1 n=2 Tax=Acipenser ruthenus TaxID=7906 RepID=UPI002742816A|nr:zinc finger protein 821-like isoform X1 [Acipenser ruthenus]
MHSPLLPGRLEIYRVEEELRDFSQLGDKNNMSRRKQTNPFKVNWSFPSAGLAGPEHSVAMEGRADFTEDGESHSNNSHEADEQDSVSEDSDSDQDNPDSSSNTSADDTLMSPKCGPSDGDMKEECNGGNDLNNSYICPLCHVECGSPKQVIAHVYQHTTMFRNSKSYVCPVCGRALSSPGSLGRHLLIHSEDRLSNCAVCGSHFTDMSNFNREKLRDFLSPENSNSKGGSSLSQPLPDLNPNLIPNLASSIAPLPALPSLSDSLNSPTPFPPLLPDVLNPGPVYPAGILLVCNSCVAYQNLVEIQSSSMRKWAVRRQNEPMESRMHRLEREREAKKSKRASESPDERELRRLRDRESKRLQRMQETEEQRARRLQRDREAMRQKRATETPEKRQARLIREREAKRLKRRLEKIDPTLRTQIEHDPAAMAALTADMNLFPFPMPCPSLDNSLFMKLP